MHDRRKWRERFLAALQEQHRVYFDPAMQEMRPEYAEYTACPLCGSTESTLRFEKDWFKYNECADCALVYMNPRLNHRATQQFYNSNVNEIYNETKFHDTTLTKGDDDRNLANLDLLAKHGARSGKLLEIGCAKGFFLVKAKERGFQPYGIELNQGLYELARAAIGDTVYGIDLFDARLPAEKFDVLYMRDLIEHIPNPKPFFDELNRVGKTGAKIVLETHNVNALIHKMVGKKHTVIFGFEHPVHWSPASITAALKASGFVVDEIAYTSPDFSVRDLISHAGPATFTTILPEAVGGFRRQLTRALVFGLSLPGIRWLDYNIMSRIANSSGQGSVMRVIGHKVADVSTASAA